MLRLADWVFLGKPLKRLDVRQQRVGSDKKRFGRFYPVVVLRTWKDNRLPVDAQRPQQEIMTFDDCRADVRVGKEAAFFADKAGTVYRCFPPVVVDDSASIVHALDEAAKPVEAEGPP